MSPPPTALPATLQRRCASSSQRLPQTLDAGDAVGNINGWINTLDGAEFTNSTEIRDGLISLKEQLQANPLDGAAIGAILNDLGTWTKAAAPDNAEIQTLGDALLAGGAKLTSM